MTEPVSVSVPEPDFAAFVGIDWADQRHCWKLVVAGTHVTEKGELKQTPEELASWAAALHHRFGGGPGAVALEQSRGGRGYQLSPYPHLLVYPVHPPTAGPLRSAIFSLGAKWVA